MALGYDKLRGPFAFGGAITYGKGDYKDKAADINNSEIAGYSGSLYGSYHSVGGVKASAFASYSWLDNDIDDVRGGMRRTADHHSHAWSLGAKVGYDLFPAERVVLSPSVGLTHIRAVNKAHDEQLDGLGVIRVGTVRRNSTLLPVDLGMGFDLYKGEATLLRLGTNLGYAYDFDDDGAAGDFSYYGFDGASAMPIAKRAPGRHRFNFGAGVFWSGSRLDFTAKYDYYRRADQEAHQVRGNIGVKF
jgi:outer membrane autotransporter protein